MPLTLYYAPNTIAVATIVALNEAGLAYDTVALNYATADQTKPDFLAVNPKGRVPALLTDNGILTETGAILDYIVDLAPDAGLLPDSPYAAARVRSMIHYLASTMHVNHAHKMRGHRWADHQASFDDMAAKVPQTMTASCAFVEEEMVGPFLFGDALTIADCHLFAIARWAASDGVDMSAFPKLSAFMDLMAARPSAVAAREAGMITP